ncbi:MAG TPA: PD-(D/E)XK nuclease family protein [Rhabdochlamydiaceae bacterium]|nr:PD-(D/E)XK nuclease family protein [Rhabdochlamydiaceae bacterium]HSX38214.1 PD-(D/E)XK nuclease family protein [Chlamydiales bacterium]
MKDFKPTKLSRTKIELFCECPRCFILDRKFSVTRPSGPPFTLNNAVDALWKKEFDRYRIEQKPHPILLQNGLDIVPFQHESIDDWRNNRRGIQFLHEPTQFLVYGAPDEICINGNGELVVVDVKATSKASEINLEADWQISYKRQMEIYQWLLRQNGFKVSKRGYFVYCNGKKDETSSGCSLAFDVFVLPYDGDDSWIESKILEIKSIMDTDLLPDSTLGCKFCHYTQIASQILFSKSHKINA